MRVLSRRVLLVTTLPLDSLACLRARQTPAHMPPLGSLLHPHHHLQGHEEQGGMRIYAPSRMQSVKDMPAMTKMKFRCGGGGGGGERAGTGRGVAWRAAAAAGSGGGRVVSPRQAAVVAIVTCAAGGQLEPAPQPPLYTLLRCCRRLPAYCA